MRKFLILCGLALTLASCGTQKTATVVFNHVTGEARLNDTLQHPKNLRVDVFNKYDDELIIYLKRGDRRTVIDNVRPLDFGYEYLYEWDGLGYFYSPHMSEYMEHNNWFVFEVTYTEY